MVTSLLAKIAGVALAGTTALGGLAAAGALPASAQQAVASAASSVDISLPSPPQGSSGHHKDAQGDRPTATPHTDRPDVTETDRPDVTETADASAPDNHGVCVSYAAHIAESLGLTGRRKGAFISDLAQDHSAVSGTATSATACEAAIAKAKAAALAASSTGKPDMTRSHPADAGKASPDGSGSASHPSDQTDGQGDSTTSGGS